MKKNLARKVMLSVLSGAMLMCSSVAWAENVPGTATGNDSIAYGEAAAANDSASAYGGAAKAIGQYSSAFGHYAEASGLGATAFGKGAEADNTKATAIGMNSEATADYATAVGNEAKATGLNSVALGAFSVASDNNVVSVGSGSSNDVATYQYRKIVNVADGSIAEGSHDAVTGGQLFTELEGKADKAITLAGYGITDAYTKNAADDKFATKTELGDYAKTVDVSAALNLKANSDDVYKKTETYNQTEVDTKLEGKADKATTLEGYGITDAYTKTEIDGMLGGSSNAIAGINQRLDKTNAKINKVGAGAAALAALHPLEYDPDDKLTFSAGMGNYAGENAAALGAFYRPNEKFMVSVGGTMGNGENMVNLGLSIGLDKPNGYAKLSKRELIQKVNAMEAKYEAVEAEKEAMKAEMAEMKAMLQAILAKK